MVPAQMRALTHPCQGDGMGTVACRLQASHDTPPAPGTMPCTITKTGLFMDIDSSSKQDGLTHCFASCFSKAAKQSENFADNLKSK
jgi:hypothetical protein